MSSELLGNEFLDEPTTSSNLPCKMTGNFSALFSTSIKANTSKKRKLPKSDFDDYNLSYTTREAQAQELERLQKLAELRNCVPESTDACGSMTDESDDVIEIISHTIVRSDGTRENLHPASFSSSAKPIIELNSDGDDSDDSIEFLGCVYPSQKPSSSHSSSEPNTAKVTECNRSEFVRSSVSQRMSSTELESTKLVNGELVVNIGKPSCDPYVCVPSHLKSVLKPHQLSGIRFMYENLIGTIKDFSISPGFGCIIAHSMGLGKTIQAITFVEIFLRYTPSKKVLIIVPLNTIQNWNNEFSKWIPVSSTEEDSAQSRNFKLCILDDVGMGAREKMICEWDNHGGVLLIGYEMFRSMVQVKPKKAFAKEQEQYVTALLNPGPDLVICDEGHKIKNDKSHIAKALKLIKTRRRVVLTGYPIQNNLTEYYCMVDFVRPNYLGTKKEFGMMFERLIRNGLCNDASDIDVKVARQRTHILVEMLKGFVQRKSHQITKSILPPNYQYIVLLRKTDLQRSLYQSFLNNVAECIDENGLRNFNPLKAYAACSKIWGHPDIFYTSIQKAKAATKNNVDTFSHTQHSSKYGEETPSAPDSNVARFNELEDICELSDCDFAIAGKMSYRWAEGIMENYETGKIENSPKLLFSLAIIRETARRNEKILLFSQSLHALDLIEDYLHRDSILTALNNNQPLKRFVNYLRIDGRTSAMDRNTYINQFTNDKSFLLFLISTRAGSLGINIVSANRAIIFDVSWNPCHDAQAVCRIYRYGQTKTTYVYRLVVDNSIERSIFNRQLGKFGLLKRVVDDRQTEVDVTRDELDQLLFYNSDSDLINCEWDVDSWSLEDELLKSIASQFSILFSQEPKLHESLLSERNEVLSAEEKSEAQLSYNQDRNLYVNGCCANFYGEQRIHNPVHSLRARKGAARLPSNPFITSTSSLPTSSEKVTEMISDNSDQWQLVRKENLPKKDVSACHGIDSAMLHGEEKGKVKHLTVSAAITLPCVTLGNALWTLQPGQTIFAVRLPVGVFLYDTTGRTFNATGSVYEYVV